MSSTRPGNLLRLGIVSGRKQPAIESVAEFRNPGEVKIVPRSGTYPRPIVNGHEIFSAPNMQPTFPVLFYQAAKDREGEMIYQASSRSKLRQLADSRAGWTSGRRRRHQVWSNW